MAVKLLLGDEAVAQGALDAGISGCYAYPGTPSTEIMEYIQAAPETGTRGVHSQWSANEKTAMEEALGMSYAGKRALVCMKHVGLNVAADGFVNSAITGTLGGLVITVADDPSMHSSQNEQDSRNYAKFAMIPCLEPSNQQEAYDMLAYGLAYSEEKRVPVMMRITTRLAHSRANVTLGEALPENGNALPDDPRDFVLLPSNARRNYDRLVEKQAEFVASAETSPYNQLVEGPDKSLGIIASGIAFNYLMEAYAGATCPHPLLKVSQYPLPTDQLRQLVDGCDKVLVLEDGGPFIEEMLCGPLGPQKPVIGRLTGVLPRTGELSPAVVAACLNQGSNDDKAPSELIRVRPPRLCTGCPHICSYKAMLEAMDDVPQGHVFSDIGCYTLGALPPFNAISTCVDMGASISMAKGAADAGMRPAVAVIGDSTFTHSGMTPLLDAVWEDTPITVFIMDNGTTGMTGGQDSPATGRLVQICEGIGVPREHIRHIDPLPKRHEENVRVLREEIMEYEGLSVVIAERECIQTLRRSKKK
ncbi:MAG: indolepyruvate ferredoxin oxidoreductase [Lentisphaerae bacterium]|jgi:indolepyruvate ferredoxin oxidoreductase, alpha subunit|nr:indolepyruvate ferredoxin oxidoreductase [Lentisphaerota bacterium]MBT4815505.1 indolepyruvate ferredoxin oxidoreductase [Lentisphaerota bacterium]MBT5606516.1 indolepyruvate ferredoxin oxidoreductase [Lentisphaerota bacterium]MBT7060153.1 indolepyruvate ferredoxin oxidoreductase [Lentisphaerota bacterium]MBT7845328.1 indolepyruvate ferredoxin oxidoreductase [Lentisphaerota bacterium]